MPLKGMQFDLLSSKDNSAKGLDKEGQGKENPQLGTVTEYKLPNRDLLPFLQQQVEHAQSQKADRWTTLIASNDVIKPLSAIIHGQSPKSLLLAAESHQEIFSITQKALTSGQSKLVIACLVTQTLAEQLALQSAARKGNCCGMILNCY